jgi:chromosome segregation ATPase
MDPSIPTEPNSTPHNSNATTKVDAQAASKDTTIKDLEEKLCNLERNYEILNQEYRRRNHKLHKLRDHLMELDKQVQRMEREFRRTQ